MITESSIEIDASPAAVWDVYADVERWSEWTASITRVVALDGAGLAVGKRFEIKQPRFPKLVWAVTEVEPGASWTWRQASPGGRTTAWHRVAAAGEGRTVVTSGVDQRGPLGVLVGLLTRRLTRRYLRMEAEGLKSRSEQRQRSDAPSA